MIIQIFVGAFLINFVISYSLLQERLVLLSYDFYVLNFFLFFLLILFGFSVVGGFQRGWVNETHMRTGNPFFLKNVLFPEDSQIFSLLILVNLLDFLGGFNLRDAQFVCDLFRFLENFCIALFSYPYLYFCKCLYFFIL